MPAAVARGYHAMDEGSAQLRSFQARLPDTVQAMGLPLQAESSSSKCRPRDSSQRALGAELQPAGKRRHVPIMSGL